MAGFEELVAWQKARELTKHIYRVTSDGDFAQFRSGFRILRPDYGNGEFGLKEPQFLPTNAPIWI